MLDFYRQFIRVLERENAVLATVIAAKGSVPREIGAKMLVLADRTILGTIGGGAGEARVMDEAIEVLKTGEKRSIDIDLTGEPGRDTRGICGGTLRVWLERWSGQESIDLIENIIARLQSGESIALVTPFDERSPYLLPRAVEPENAFLETLQPAPTLLIVGAGHVGRQLAKIARSIDFEVIVQDDRPEWANERNYPNVSRILAESIDIALNRLESLPSLHVALVTRGYQHDLDALNLLLKRPIFPEYIGMIGSRKRARQVLRSIDPTGIAENRLKAIRSPIGLDIGALTPEEIAISIAAELILVRRGGTGRPLSSL